MITSRISSGVTPLRIAARRCIGSSFSARSAVSSASVRHERVRRSSPGPRPHLAPRDVGQVVLERRARTPTRSPACGRRARRPAPRGACARPRPSALPVVEVQRAVDEARPPTRGSPAGRAARPRAPRRPARRPRRAKSSAAQRAAPVVRSGRPRPSTRSASSRPPVASRFARMRSGSASSPSSDSRSQATAEPVERSSSPSGRHSACHAPAARSCSCAIAPSRVAASPGACCAHAERADRRDRVALVRHRRRARRPCASRTSATSVWESRTTSRATLATAPEVTASARRELADPPAQRVPRQHRLGQPERSAYALGHRGPASPSEASVPAAPPSCAARRSTRSSFEPAPRVLEPGHPARGLEPERDRHRLLEQRAPRHRRVAVGARERPRPRSRAAARSSSSGSSARAVTSIAAVSRMSWLVAPRCTCAGGRALDRLGQRRLQRHHRVARAGRGGRDRRGVEALGHARRRDRLGLGLLDQARARQRARERRLGVEHRLQPRLVRDCRGRARRARRSPRTRLRGLLGAASRGGRSSATKRVAIVSSRWTTPITMKNAAAVPSSEKPRTNGEAIRKIAST